MSRKYDTVRIMGKNHIERILHTDRLLREDTFPSRKDLYVDF